MGDKSRRGVRELLEGVDDGVDLGDDDGEALEHHRRHELPVAPFFRGRAGRRAEASRPPEKPGEKARHRRRSGVGCWPAGGRASGAVSSVHAQAGLFGPGSSVLSSPGGLSSYLAHISALFSSAAQQHEGEEIKKTA